MSQGSFRHCLIVCVVIILLAACTNGGGSGNNSGDGITDTTAPTASVSTSPSAPTPDSSLISEITVFTISFSESMDTASLVIGGDMAGESDGGAWSQTSAKNDTLVISPKTTWSASTHRTLIINARDLAGNALATLTVIRDVSSGFVYYVDTNMADDSGDGLSPATAKKFIHTAVANAIAPATILVRAGDYRLSHALGTHVVIKEKVSLFGGYNADFTQRDPETNITTIEDRSDTSAGSLYSPHAAIIGDNSSDPITPATVIDGFTILGSTQAGAAYTSAMYLTGASPTVQNNILNGGGGSQSSVGLLNDSNATPHILNSSIDGGSGAASSLGMLNHAASPIIQDNTIDGGSGGTDTQGMYNDAMSSPTVQNNLIYSGSASISYGVNNLDDSPAIFRNNTIISNKHAFRNRSSSPSLQNNILMTTAGSNTYCFYEAIGTNSTPQTLRNNAFFNCSVLYLDRESGCTTDHDGDGDDRTCTIDEINALTDIAGGVSGNVSVDPQFIDIDGVDNDISTMTDNNWHLSIFTPASILQGGLNGIDEGWSLTDDKDGVIRPASGNAWSTGAYELAAFTHADYIDNFTCASAGCHDGATPEITGKSLSHADTTDMCEACHVTTTWVPVITPFDHSQVITSVCSDCHDGSYPNISYKSNTHPGTTDVCEGCHINTNWTTYKLPIDHNQVLATTACMDCHDGTIATGKGPTHISTSLDCDVCHTTDTWLGAPPP